MATQERPNVVWRIGIVLLGTAAIWSLMIWVGLTVFDRTISPLSRLVSAVIVFGLAVPMIVLARKYLDRGPWSTLRVQVGRTASRPFLIGVTSFLVPSALGLTVALSAGWVSVTIRVPWWELIASTAFLIVMVLLFEAIPEELIFRGYIYRNLSAAMAPIAAVFIQAVLFAAFGTALWVLTSGWSVLIERGTIFLAMGIVAGLLRLISGSVWNPIGFHFAFQVVAQTLFGPLIAVSDSGAATVFAIVVAFVFATTITLLLTRRRPNWTSRESDDALGEAQEARTRAPGANEDLLA